MGLDAVQGRLVAELGVPRETLTRLTDYVNRLTDENRSQNLIAATTLAGLWDRHILDSAQLLPLVEGNIVDIGSGAGLPGLVLAILGCSVTLVEPRRLRAEFLQRTAAEMKLSTPVHMSPVERLVSAPFDTITTRAYAPLDKIFASASHLADDATRWVLPKGRSALSELDVARRAWHGDFRTIPSITNPEALIVIAEGVRPKAQR